MRNSNDSFSPVATPVHLPLVHPACFRSTICASAFAALFAWSIEPASAGADAINGAWSGTGSIEFSSGAREAARCRARIQRRSAGVFSVEAICATASARVQQTAQIRHLAGSRYAGTFYNAEYNVGGRITVSGTANTLRAALVADGGSASMVLRR